MTTYKASARNVKASVKRIKPVIDLVRYRTIDDACVILQHSNRRAGQHLIKLLTGAKASIRHNYQVRDPLTIAEIFATKGRTTRRAYRQSRVRKNNSSRMRWPRKAGVCHVYVSLTPTIFVKSDRTRLGYRRRGINLQFRKRQLLGRIVAGLVESKN